MCPAPALQYRSKEVMRYRGMHPGRECGRVFCGGPGCHPSLSWPQGIGPCQLAILCRLRLAPGNTGLLCAGWADVWGGQHHTRRPSAHTVGICGYSWPLLILPGSSSRQGQHRPPPLGFYVNFPQEVAVGHI